MRKHGGRYTGYFDETSTGFSTNAWRPRAKFREKKKSHFSSSYFSAERTQHTGFNVEISGLSLRPPPHTRTHRRRRFCGGGKKTMIGTFYVYIIYVHTTAAWKRRVLARQTRRVFFLSLKFDFQLHRVVGAHKSSSRNSHTPTSYSRVDITSSGGGGGGGNGGNGLRCNTFLIIRRRDAQSRFIGMTFHAKCHFRYGPYRYLRYILLNKISTYIVSRGKTPRRRVLNISH